MLVAPQAVVATAVSASSAAERIDPAFVVVASRLMWKIERRSSGIPSIASRDRHRLESRRGGYESIAALAIVALRGSERSRFSRPWTRSARAQLDGVTPRA